jgi:uncharacterized protein YbjT (DUF2867 family)
MKILLAGATGYLGLYIAKELQKSSRDFKALVRNPRKLKQNGILKDNIFKAELTDPSSLLKCCDGIDVVISTVGITRQKDGLTYMDVDYQANINLLNEAKKSGVKKFLYISALNADKLRDLKICDAKEMFADALKESGLPYCTIRPNGFFSDISEYFNMAKKGKVYLFGDGNLKANPIHGEDLALFCLEAIDRKETELEVGGPQILSQKEIALLAFEVLGTKPKLVHIQNWLRVAILRTVKLFFGVKTYGPIEFFLSVMNMEMIAPKYGKHTLKEYFSSLHVKHLN